MTLDSIGVTAPTLDVDFVRAQFPGLGDLAFFENAGGTLVPRQVIERVRAYMTECQVQPGGDYAPSDEAARRIESGHRLMAEMIDASPEEVIVGISTTMNVYLLAQALRPLLREGDEVIVTDLDHEANNGAWRRLCEFGVVVREWRVNRDTADLEIDDLDALLGDRTRLVCFSHCSNITGSINDVAEIVRRVHAAGAWACVDAVAFAPHAALDVKGLDVDFYLCSLYKLYGPHLALLYGKHDLLLEARAQNHYFIGEDDTALKLAPGGPNHELSAALPGIVEYLDAVHAHHYPGSNAPLHERVRRVFTLAAAHEERIAAPLAEFLAGRADVRVVGRAGAERTRRVPTFSFVADGRDSSEIPAAAAAHRVGIRAGHFYAKRLVDALDLGEHGGVVRASMVHYNTADEVDRLIRALDEAL